MAFDANRNMKIEASQNADGTFVLRTKGLAGHKRAELEVSGVPEPALMAAGRILNDTAEYAVNRAEIIGDPLSKSRSQRVGLDLPISQFGHKDAASVQPPREPAKVLARE